MTSRADSNDTIEYTNRAFQPAGRLSARLMRDILKDQKSLLPQIQASWEHIVGKYIATLTFPFKLTYPHGKSVHLTKKLHLQVEPAAALEIQHMEAQVCDRINLHFGKTVVTSLTLLQRPLPQFEKHAMATRPAAASTPLAAKTLPDTIELGLQQVENPRLREALRRWAAHVD